MISSPGLIVVVGGGAAGIAAARRLRDAGEDVLLVERLGRAGAVLVRIARLPVTTSDRSAGRAPDGVATDLAELAALETPRPGEPVGAVEPVDAVQAEAS